MQIEDENIEEFPISYSIDHAVLMHRDAHFGGDFPTMLEYYKKEGKGTSKDFDLSHIEALYEMERKSGKNLSSMLLSGAEAEKIAQARQAYKSLREIYEINNAKNALPRLIADLILAEEEETPSAIEAVAAKKVLIVPALIDLLRNEEFYDPLFPGYGQAPALAAQCLGRIGDKRAIIALFEAIGEGDFFNEDTILDALHAVGQPAKEFLLKVLHGHPITMDNEQAAVALIKFKDDPEVSSACLKMLQELDLKKHAPLATYLVLACESLATEEQRQGLLTLAKQVNTPKMIQQDIAVVAKIWKTEKECK